MENIAGVFGLAAGAWLLVSALQRRARFRAGTLPAAPASHPSLVAMGEAVPPLINAALFIVGGQVVLAYAVTDLRGWFGPLDLAGFLFLLFGYGVWLSVKVKCRPGRLAGSGPA